MSDDVPVLNSNEGNGERPILPKPVDNKVLSPIRMLGISKSRLHQSSDERNIIRGFWPDRHSHDCIVPYRELNLV